MCRLRILTHGKNKEPKVGFDSKSDITMKGNSLSEWDRDEKKWETRGYTRTWCWVGSLPGGVNGGRGQTPRDLKGNKGVR